MAVKISDLTAMLAALEDTDLVVLVDVSSGETVKLTVAALRTAMQTGAVLDADFAGAFAGFLRRTGAGAYVAVKSNLTAVVPPTNADDAAAGYSHGSVWSITEPGSERTWIYVGEDAGEVAWIEITRLAHGAAPTVNDDTEDGYRPGSLWSYPTVGLWICRSSTLGAAAWDAVWLAADDAKLDGIETGADVTDATNVAAAGAVMDGDFAGAALGRLTRVGAGAYAVVKDNLAAAAAPTATDDGPTGGYAVGSLWYYPGVGLWMASSVGDDAAVWDPLWPERTRPQDTASEAFAVGSATGTEHGLSYFTTSANPITVTVDQGKAGTVLSLVQGAAGQITLSAGSGVTLQFEAAFLAKTAQQWSRLVIEWRTATLVHVDGGMEAV